MAIKLSPESIPAQILTPERRTWRIQIECPLGGIPRIEAFRHIVKRDENGAVVDVGALTTDNAVVADAQTFAKLCPDFAHLLTDIPAAIDALEAELAISRAAEAQTAQADISA